MSIRINQLFQIFRIFLFLTSFVTFCNPQEDEHRIQPLRVSLTNQVPFHILKQLPDGSYENTGSSAGVFKWLARKLNRPLVLVVPTEEELKKYGFIKACVNKVFSGEVDTTAAGILIDPDQLDKIDFSYPIILSPLKMIVRAGEEESRLFAFVRPFQPMVWLFLFVSLVCSLIAASGIAWLYAQVMDRNQRSGRSSGPSVGDAAAIPFTKYLNRFTAHTISIITAHGCSDPFSRNGLRIFGALWLLIMTVMVYGYSGLLISCLTVPTWTKPIETLEDVATSKEVVLRVPTDGMGGLSKAVTEGESGVWKALGDQLRQHPKGLYKKPLTEADFSIANQNFATAQVEYWTKWMISRVYKKEKKCRYHQTARIPFSARFYYPMPKGREDNQKISKGVMEMWEFGLLDHWTDETFHVPNAEKCFDVKQRKSTKNVPIKLVDLTGAFLILGIGLGLAVLCFLLEIIVAKYQREMKQQQRKLKVASAVTATVADDQILKNDNQLEIIVSKTEVEDLEESAVVELK